MRDSQAIQYGMENSLESFPSTCEKAKLTINNVAMALSVAGWGVFIYTFM